MSFFFLDPLPPLYGQVHAVQSGHPWIVFKLVCSPGLSLSGWQQHQQLCEVERNLKLKHNPIDTNHQSCKSQDLYKSLVVACSLWYYINLYLCSLWYYTRARDCSWMDCWYLKYDLDAQTIEWSNQAFWGFRNHGCSSENHAERDFASLRIFCPIRDWDTSNRWKLIKSEGNLAWFILGISRRPKLSKYLVFNRRGEEMIFLLLKWQVFSCTFSLSSRDSSGTPAVGAKRMEAYRKGLPTFFQDHGCWSTCGHKLEQIGRSKWKVVESDEEHFIEQVL